jgi:hypothetical protein
VPEGIPQQKKDMPMKLKPATVERTLAQFPAQAIPADHPAVPQLNSLFGDHTFFLDSKGLSILEPAPAAPKESAQVIRLADWKDAERTGLVPHEPEETDVVVALKADEGDEPVN